MDAKWCENCGSRFMGDECPNCADPVIEPVSEPTDEPADDIDASLE